MPKYRVTYSSIQLYDVEIEATSAEEAEAIASDMDGSEF